MSEVYVIAEAGVNHDGSLDTALALVDAARAAGADAVKFQTFNTDRLVSRRAKRAEYQERNLGAGDDTQASMLRALELQSEDFRRIAEHARACGIEFLSTPFDEDSLKLLVGLGVRRLKLGSGDLTNAFLLRAAASTRLPMILSSGMATLGEIEAALMVIAATWVSAASAVEAFSSDVGQALLTERVALLHCTTEYPAPVAETNLRVIPVLREAFGLRVGYSDHTEGLAVSVGAVALGATIIEKHFTLDRKRSGPDHAASLEPGELRQLVSDVRAIEAALGTGRKRPGASELKNIRAARRSLVAVGPIRQGERITADMLVAKRPGGGISPMRFDEVVGRIATRAYEADDPIEP